VIFVSETSPAERLRHIQGLLLNAESGGSLGPVRAELHVFETELAGKIQDLEANRDQLEKMKQKVEQYDQPPLQHALVLGASPRHDGTFVVSVGGERFDVAMARFEEPDHQLPVPHDGQEVLITRDTKVIVGVVGEVRRGESVQVIDVLREAPANGGDRLLVRWGSGEGVVVEMAERLRGLPPSAPENEPRQPRAGDTVLVDMAARMAFETIPAHQTSALRLEHDPKGSYEDIAGLEGKIEVIRDAIELPYLYRELFKRYQLARPTGILLYGPPGCGKTMIGRAVANGLKARIEEQLRLLIEALELYTRLADGGSPDEASLVCLARICPAAGAPGLAAGERAALLRDTLGAEYLPDLQLDLEHPQSSIERLRRMAAGVRGSFLNIKGPELLSKWVGEAEGRIRQIFSEAKSYASYTTPVVVFFDEIESMFQRRGSGISTDLEKTMVPALLTELDGIEELSNVVLIGASNRHENLDPALMRPGRLDIKIKIDRPDREATAAIFHKHLRPDLPLSDEGLLGLSVGAFDAEVLRALERLAGAGGQVCIGSGAADFRSVPLSALPPELLPVIAGHARASGAADGGSTDRRLRARDLAAAIEEICRTHAQRLFGLEKAPVDGGMRVVLDLRHAEEALADLPPIPAIFAELPAAGGPAAPAEICRRLIETAVDLLFSSQSYLAARLLAACGSQHTFLLREFVSGALIENVVTRAKRLALKRESVLQRPSSRAGLALADLVASLRTEFMENKDHLILNRPELVEASCAICKRRHNSPDEYSIELRLGYSAHDRWRQPRRPPYERKRGRQAGPPSQAAPA